MKNIVGTLTSTESLNTLVYVMFIYLNNSLLFLLF